MLGLGIAIGYLLRPAIAGLVTPATATPLAALAAPDTGEASTLPTATPDMAQATQAAAVMEAVIARTRHFKGNPNAPVTLIEFGDFQ
jgi:hypothetical protein